MKDKKMTGFRSVCLWAGIGLLLAAGVLMLVWQWNVHSSQKKSAESVHMLRTLIPEPQDAVPEERTDNTMPVLSLDGTDFIGILEMPRYGSALPVCADWGRSTTYPRCLSGSVYDRTVQIGGTSQKGQYDFYREISVGDRIFFTDVSGNRYPYTVTDLRYESHADQTALHRRDAALTLFIKNVYAFEYIIIFCDTLG